MQIVINISEHDKNVLTRFVRGEGTEELAQGIIEGLIRAVYFGTPLPEHHGRLIDAEVACPNHTECVMCPVAIECSICAAPTVIPSTKEGDDE